MPAFMPPTVAQVLVILVPCYAVAYATDKMVYVVPTLAAALVLSRALTLKTDDDHDGEGDDAEGEGDGNGNDAGSGVSGGMGTGQGCMTFPCLPLFVRKIRI